VKYSYATIALPTLEPAAACAELAAAGFTGIEWRVGEPTNSRREGADDLLPSNLCTLEQTVASAIAGATLAESAGLTVVGLAPYIRTGDLAALQTVLDMTVASHSSQVRIQAPRFERAGVGYGELLNDFVTFLDAAVVLSGPMGVRLAIELHHKTMVPSVGLAMPILARHSPDQLGVIFDVGNLVFEGFEDYRIGLELLGPYLHHVHLKNVRAGRRSGGHWVYEWSPLDDGFVDVRHVLELIEATGYDGWVSIEDLSFGADSSRGIQHNADVLTRIAAPGWRGNAVKPINLETGKLA
jgi:sugar phosphate isomerase/epimerase